MKPSDNPARLTRLLAGALVAAPALLIGLLIFNHGVDTPWGDQWDGTLPLFEKLQAGTLRFADFFALHNEHRIFFPRLIAFSLARLTNWNVRAELLIIWLLACVCAINVACLARVTVGSDFRSRTWLLLGANLLLFTPLQWENLLWGFQIGFFLPLAVTTACFWISHAVRPPFNFLFTLVLCVICTFSIASGFSCWILTAPVLWFSADRVNRRASSICWSVWIATAAASVVLYFHGFTRPATHTGPLEVLKHPIEALGFVCAYLGNPFTSGNSPQAVMVAQLAGLSLVIVLITCAAYLWRHRHDGSLVVSAVPWLALTFIALINASLTALGRLGLEHGAMQSRYVSFAVMLPIGLLFIVPIVLQHRVEQSTAGVSNRRWRVAVVTISLALGILFVTASLRSLHRWSRFHHLRLTGRAALLLINVVDDPEGLAHYVHAGDPALKARTNLLDRLGYLRPPLVRSSHIRDLASSLSETVGGLTQLDVSTSGGIRAGGWAILPQHQRVADSVLLTYEDDRQDPIIFARADVGIEIPNADDHLDNKGYNRSGWTKSWKAAAIPASAQRISAWAFDAEECKAFLIDTAPIPPR